MKKLTLSLVAVAGLWILLTAQVQAFPLTLTSLTGTITSTHHYGTNAGTTSNVVSKVAITSVQVITVLSNEVFLDLGTNPPGDMRIALDPYTQGLYLTNNSGFFYDVEGNGLGSFSIREVATGFSQTSTATEQDTMLISFSFNGRTPDGKYIEFSLRGAASFKYVLNDNGVGAISLAGKKMSGYGEFDSSDSGVSQGNFLAKGTGVPEWTGPFSVFWWNN